MNFIIYLFAVLKNVIYGSTIFFTTSVEYSYLSSSIVKEVASYGGDIRKFLPECIVQTVYDKYAGK